MSPEQLRERVRVLDRLAQVREQRRRARAREFDKRMEALARAQQALRTQQGLLDSAKHRLEQSHRVITGVRPGERVDGARLGQQIGWIAFQRAAVATEQAATVAARTACDMIQREVTKAGDALRAAAVAQHKTSVAHGRAQVQYRQEAEAADERALDELAVSMRPAAAAPRAHEERPR